MPTTAPLTLPRRLIPAVMLLGCGGAPTPPVAAELERSGVTVGGNLAARTAELVAVMTEPDLIVSVAVTTRDAELLSTIWSTGPQAVWGRPVDRDVYQLRSIEAVTIPLLLAQLTGVGRRPEPPFGGSIGMPSRALKKALDFAGDDPDTALGILLDAGVDETWADRVLIANQHMRARWRVSSVWTPPDLGPSVHEATVLDAGPAGYWHITTSDTDHVTYTVASLAQTMRVLRGCLPDLVV